MSWLFRYKMNVFMSEKALISLILSSVEVYKNECIGSLYGHQGEERVVVEYAIPYQTAKRKPSEVEPVYHRESRVLDLLDEICSLEHVGYFHSHCQRGDIKASESLSEPDKESISPSQIEIVLAVNDSKRWIPWGVSRKVLYGALHDYRFRIAAYMKLVDSERIIKCRVICPYAVGINDALEI